MSSREQGTAEEAEMTRYGMKRRVAGEFDEVKQRAVEALKGEGFGVLSEIDVRATLESKLGVEMERYEILGACNPQLAREALDLDRSLGLLLPCNVVVREVEDGTEVSIVDPQVMFEVADDDSREKLAPLAAQARERLQRSLDQLAD